MMAAGSVNDVFHDACAVPGDQRHQPQPGDQGRETQSIAPDSETCSGGVITASSSTASLPTARARARRHWPQKRRRPHTEQGCIDFSRSSSPPAPATETLELSATTESGDPSPSSLDYYAYALDGVGPLVGSDAPTSVRTAGSDTGAVEGLDAGPAPGHLRVRGTPTGTRSPSTESRAHNAPIALFWPQSGSGTRAVMTDVLGFDPTKSWGVALSLHRDHPADHRIRARRCIRERREHRGRHHLPEQHR